MKIANIDREFFIFSERLGNQVSTLSIEDAFFRKPQGAVNLTLPPPYLPPGRLGLNSILILFVLYIHLFSHTESSS